MKTYTALIVKKLSTRLGQFSVDTFASFTGYLEVVRENWLDSASFPGKFALSEWAEESWNPRDRAGQIHSTSLTGDVTSEIAEDD